MLEATMSEVSMHAIPVSGRHHFLIHHLWPYKQLCWILEASPPFQMITFLIYILLVVREGPEVEMI